MSRAPVPWLRHWWSLGGAPGAFMQRDERLTRACERLVRQSDVVAAMGKGDAYAALVAPVDLDRILPAEADASVDAGDQAMDAPRVRRPAEAVSTSDGPRKRVDRRVPVLPAGSRYEQAARIAPSTPSPHHSRPERSSDAADHRLQSVDANANEAPSRRIIAARDAQESERHAAPDVAARPWMSRVVPALGRELQPEVVRRVEQLLREAAPPSVSLTSRGEAAARSEAQAHPAAPGQATSTRPQVVDRLAQVVRRVEQRFIERGAAPAQSWSTPDERRLPRDVGVSARRSDDRGAAVRTIPGAERLRSQTQATGLRGLVERASFLGVRDSSNTDALWPDSELDQLSALIDTAARFEGVPLEEGLS